MRLRLAGVKPNSYAIRIMISTCLLTTRIHLIFQYVRFLASEADNEYAMLDSTIVRAHQHSAGAQKKTAKIKRSGAAKAG